MRIKINLADLQRYLRSSTWKSWFLLDPDCVKTVEDLAKDLTLKFRLQCNSESLQLMLDDYLLPDWESTHILRDGDTVRFVFSLHDDCNKNVGFLLELDSEVIDDRKEAYG